MFRKIFLAIAVLTLVTMACGFEFNVPTTPGVEATDDISIPAPEGEVANLTLEFGAGELTLAPGAFTALVSGTATYNLVDLKPVINTSGSDVTMSVGRYRVRNFPTFDGLKNQWDLKLGSMPMALSIHAGAYDGEYDFGGLALTNLTIQDGAADVRVTFSSPNQTEMSVLRYESGASSIEMTGLGNANFSTMIFQAGAGNYTLDFSGNLQRDATVSIETGVSNFTLIVPEGVNAKLTVEGGLSNITSGRAWDQNGNTYVHTAEGPLLTIVVEIGAGNLILE